MKAIITFLLLLCSVASFSQVQDSIDEYSFWVDLTARSSGLYLAPAVEFEGGDKDYSINIRLSYGRNLMDPHDDIFLFGAGFGWTPTINGSNQYNRFVGYIGMMHGPFQPKQLLYMTPTAVGWEWNPFQRKDIQIEILANWYWGGYYPSEMNHPEFPDIPIREGSRFQPTIRIAKRLAKLDMTNFR